MKKKRSYFLLLLLCAGLATQAQQKPVHGHITSPQGAPLSGITVVIKGTKKTVVTDANGNFTITAAKGDVLQLSFVGYESKEVKVGDGDISASLVDAQTQLNTVVVTALGITKEAKKVGYAITTVDGDQLNKARETNVALSLAGQVAGLNVHGTSGGPGGTSRVLLRGMPSQNSGGSPLYVVNGVPIDNSQRGSAGEWGGSDAGDGIGNINPDDVESMTVLKGQAASALYGTRATNGVILITTKKGKKGQMSVDFNTNNVVDQPINYTDFQNTYGQGVSGAKPTTAANALATDRLAWGAKLDGSNVIGYDGKTYAYSAYNNNFKDFYRTGATFTNTVSVSSGTDRGSFRLSASNLDNSSTVINSGLSRKTVNLNVDQKITDKLTVSVLANYIYEEGKNRSSLSDGPGNPNNFTFLAPNVNSNIFKPGYDANGNEIVFSDDNYVTNPWFVVNKWIINTQRKRLISAFSAKYNFTDWIYVMGRVGYDNINDRYLNIEPTGTNYTINSAGQSGSIKLNNVQTNELNMEGAIGVKHKIVSDLSFDATIGGNIRKNNDETIGEGGGQFVLPNLYTPYNVVSFNRTYIYHQKEVHSGYYTVDFSYKNFLNLNTTGRYDAYSTLYNSLIPKNQRDIFTQSVSGSFVFSEFLKDMPALSFGKLRAAYAQTSGEPSDPYQTATYYAVGNSINGTPTGNFSTTLPNLFLKPFTLTEVEVGAELKFFKNRLGLDVSYFSRKSKNEIISATLSASTGYTSAVTATGATQNKGLEVLLTGTPIAAKKFNWNVSFNFTNVTNKILETDAAGNSKTQGTYRPLNANTAFVKGLAGPQIMAYDYTYDAKGNIIVDGSGLPVQGVLKPYGSVLPTFYGGLKNDFTMGNFNFSFLIDYNFGNKILSATKYYSIYRGLDKMTLAGRETGITVAGVTAAGATNTVVADAQSYYQRLATISKVNVLDGDYIKLRQVAIGYTLSEKLLEKLPLIRSIQLSLVARNLLVLMKHSGNIDPESQFAASVKYAGIEGTSLPSTRTFGVNASFKFK